MKRNISVTLRTPKKRRRILLRATGTVSLTEPVDFVCSRTVAELRRPVRGSTKEPCTRCKVLLWIAPSTRKATKAPAVCLDCAKEIAMEELRDKIAQS